MSLENCALIAHANAFLKFGEPMPPWRNLSGLNLVEEFEMGLFWNRSKRFASPQDWADWLKSNGVYRARLFIAIDQFDALVGRFEIETDGENGQMVWRSHHESIYGLDLRMERPTGEPFRWICRGEDLDPRERRLTGDLEDTEREFRQTLRELEELCGEGWKDHFRRAKEQLENPSPGEPPWPNVFPKRGYSLSVRQLFYAAKASAGLCAGKPLDRDEQFSDPEFLERLDVLSSKLSKLICLAYVVALDSFDETR